jgi:ubiquitin C-terminal hydrolase
MHTQVISHTSEEKKNDYEIERKKLTVRGLSGLKNQGNTCYMNSIIQCLASLDLFRTWMVSKSFKKRLYYNYGIKLVDKIRKDNKFDQTKKIKINQSDLEQFSQNSIVYRLAEVFENMWKQNCYITPQKLKDKIGESCESFRGYRQHDSQELLNEILDKIHEETKAEVIVYPEMTSGVNEYLYELKKCNSIMNDPLATPEDKEQAYYIFCEYKKNHVVDAITASSIQFWRSYVSKSHSIITDLFTGLFYSKIVCKECGLVSGSFEPFTTLSVPTKEDGETSIDESIREFIKEEILSGDNQYFCDHCKKKVDATKKMCIWEPPNILIVHLKRFKNDRYGSTKTSSKVIFPTDNLDIQSYLSDLHNVKNTTYKLTSISEHRGTCNFGHYVAYCQNSINNKWYEFNDDSVYHVPDDELAKEIVTKNAYILLYTRIFE